MSTVNPILEYRGELEAAAARRIVARRRRVLIGVAAGAVAVVTTSFALAATRAGWLTGEPAPPPVVEGFRQYTPQLGFHPAASAAQFVAQDGPIKLYATANREGGICYLVDEPWKPANAGDGGTCASQEKANEPITAGLLGLGPASAEGIATIVIAGRVADTAARTIRFVDPGGAVVERPLGAGGFYIAAVRAKPLDFAHVFTRGEMRCPRRQWDPRFVALDEQGHSVAETNIPLMQSAACATGGEATPHGPYRQH
jgi:hypothetical protein